MYENNLKGLFTYFTNKGSEYLLADEPKGLKDKLDIKSAGVRKKGFTANEKVNSYGRKRIADWLERPSYNDPTRTNLQYIKSIGLIEELIAWNKDGNFDRVSAMIGLMIYLDEIEISITKGVDDTNAILKSKFFTNITKSPHYRRYVL
jgi:hypothetical protein